MRSRLRAATPAERRLDECEKLGFRAVLAPRGTPPRSGLALVEAETVRDAVREGLEEGTEEDD